MVDDLGGGFPLDLSFLEFAIAPFGLDGPGLLNAFVFPFIQGCQEAFGESGAILLRQSQGLLFDFVQQMSHGKYLD